MKLKSIFLTALVTIILATATKAQELISEIKTNHNFTYIPYIKFSNSGKLIATGDPLNDFVNIWDVQSGKLLFKFSNNDKKPIGAFNFSSDDKFLVVGTYTNKESTNTLTIWNLEIGQMQKKFDMDHGNGYDFVQFLGEGDGPKVNLSHYIYDKDKYWILPAKIITTGCYDKEVRVWDVSNGNCISKSVVATKAGFIRAAISPDNNWIAADDDQNNEINIIPIENNSNNPFKLTGHKNDMWSHKLFFSLDGRFLISSDDATWKVWDLVSKKLKYSYNLPYSYKVNGIISDKFIVENTGSELKFIEIDNNKSIKSIYLDKKSTSSAIFNVIPQTIETYYKANIENYKWKDRARISKFDCNDEKTAKKVQKLLAKGTSDRDVLKELNKKSTVVNRSSSYTFVEKGDDTQGKFEWKEGIQNIGLNSNGSYVVIKIHDLKKPEPKSFNDAKSLVEVDYKNYIENIWPKQQSENLKIAVAFNDGTLRIFKVDFNRKNEFKPIGSSDFGIGGIVFEEKGDKSHERYDESFILKQKIMLSLCYSIRNFSKDVDVNNDKDVKVELKRLSNLLSNKLGLKISDITNPNFKEAVRSINSDLDDVFFKNSNTEGVILYFAEIWLKNISGFCGIQFGFDKVISIDAYHEQSQADKQSEKNTAEIARKKQEMEENKMRKFCYNTLKGKYELTLFEDGSKKVIYNLYNSSGQIQKTIQGIWEMKDEGVYGSAYKITISWTGSNSSLPEKKYVCQFDGGGILQNIIDNENRTWYQCY